MKKELGEELLEHAIGGWGEEVAEDDTGTDKGSGGQDSPEKPTAPAEPEPEN